MTAEIVAGLLDDMEEYYGAFDHFPPAIDKAVCPPAEPPNTPTESKRRVAASASLPATTSMAWETSIGRLIQLAGPGSDGSR